MKRLLLLLLVGIFLISFASALNLTAMTVEYYKFDSSGTSTAMTGSVGYNSLTVANNGNNNWVSGKIGNGYALDGNDNVASGKPYVTNRPMTINFWIKYTGTQTIYNGLMTKMDSSCNPTTQQEFVIDNRVGSASGSPSMFSSVGQVDTTTKSSDTWYMVTYIVNGSGIYSLQDGVNIEESLSTSFNSGTSNFNFFKNPDCNNRYTNAVIDELAIFNYSLNSSDIATLYNAGNGLTYPYYFPEPQSDLFVNLTSPVNGTIISAGSQNLSVMITPTNANLTNATFFLWSSNGTLINQTTNGLKGNVSNFTSLVIGNLPTTTLIWNVYGCVINNTGSLCKFASSNYSFKNTPFTLEAQYFTNQAYETDRESYNLTLAVIPSVLSVTGTLVYNGTRYPSTTSCISGNCSLSAYIDLPVIPDALGSINYSFFWNISVFDGSSEQSYDTISSGTQQNVSRIYAQICDAGVSTIAINITAYDENNRSRVMPFDFQGTLLKYWIGNGDTYRNQTLSSLDKNETTICILPSNKNFHAEAIMDYEATGYLKRDYHFVNQLINSSIWQLPLYLIQTARATTFIIQVQDINQFALPNYYVYIQRYYPGTDSYETINVVKTDDNGKTVGFYETETVYYRHIITDSNGNIVLTTGRQKIFGESTPYTLLFTVGESRDLPWSDFLNETDVSYGLVFNETSKIVTFTYIDTNSSFAYGNLTVTKINPSTGETIICSSQSALSSAIITCDLSSYNSGLFTAIGHIERSGNAKDKDIVISLDLGKDTGTFGMAGLFLAYMIILVSASIFIYNVLAGIWTTTAAIILVNIIGIASFSMVFIFGVIAVAVILTVVLGSRQ